MDSTVHTTPYSGLGIGKVAKYEAHNDNSIYNMPVRLTSDGCSLANLKRHAMLGLVNSDGVGRYYVL
jgi:hypothetical protein